MQAKEESQQEKTRQEEGDNKEIREEAGRENGQEIERELIMGTRRNITTSVAARDAFVQGVLALKSEPAGLTTGQLGFVLHPAGIPSQQLSTQFDPFEDGG